ncbi:MAG TPA: hypothetical protein VF105_06240 [Gemmatimonadaceae bacterium]
MLVLGGTRDNMLKTTEIEATARAYGTSAEIIADVAHDMMIEVRWRTVAERILVWLNEITSAPFKESRTGRNYSRIAHK